MGEGGLLGDDEHRHVGHPVADLRAPEAPPPLPAKAGQSVEGLAVEGSGHVDHRFPPFVKWIRYRRGKPCPDVLMSISTAGLSAPVLTADEVTGRQTTCDRSENSAIHPGPCLVWICRMVAPRLRVLQNSSAVCSGVSVRTSEIRSLILVPEPLLGVERVLAGQPHGCCP
jgi:hypothetical protein